MAPRLDSAEDAEESPEDQEAEEGRLEQGAPEEGTLRLEAQFYSESRVPVASAAKEVSFRAALTSGSEEGRVQLEQLECRAATCKLVAVFASAQAYNSTYERLFLHRDVHDDPASLPAMSVVAPEQEWQEDGSLRVTLYADLP